MTERKNLTGNENIRGGITMEIKPLSFYSDEPSDTRYEDIREGDLTIAQVETFLPHMDTIILKVGENVKAEMKIDDFDNDSNREKKIKAIYHSIGTRLVVRVKKKEEGLLILERKSVEKDTVDYLSAHLGTVVDATVKTIVYYGLFIDIGNGIISLLPISEISKFRITNLQNFFSVGDNLKVKLLSYNPENSFFKISRKEAYKKWDESDLSPNTGFVVTCINFVANELSNGVYVEYDPANVGIVDIPPNHNPEEFFAGRKMVVSLRSIKEKGFKAHFINFL